MEDDEAKGAYYLWKWADNEISGIPEKVCRTLEQGQWHQALETFDAAPAIKSLAKAAKAAKKKGAEWTWEPVSGDGPDESYFIVLWGPPLSVINAETLRLHIEPFESALEKLGIIACHVTSGLLPGNFPPKINNLNSGQGLRRPEFDASEERVIELIKALRADKPHAFVGLSRNNRDYVQTFRANECYVLEWRDYHNLKKPFDHWRMYDVDGGEADEDFFRLPAIGEVFAAFMRGEPRPEKRHWRNMNDQFKN